MELQKKLLRRGWQSRLALTALAGAFASSSMAGLLNLSNNVVEVVSGIGPNIMILLDDSASMDWEIITPAPGGRFAGTQPDGSSPADSGTIVHRSGCDFNSATDVDGSSAGYMYGVKFSKTTNACDVAPDSAWRFRNHNFNPLYFDPTRDYSPWAGGKTVNGTFIPFDNINITAAPEDPYNNASENIDLTSRNSMNQAQAGGFWFYTWIDDGDDVFEDAPSDQIQGYQIGLVTDAQAQQWGKTAAQLKQNFANWFSYHRSRELAAKAALGQALKDNDTAYVGFATTNNSSNTQKQVEFMNASPASGTKKALFDAIYSTNLASSGAGTTLRSKLDAVGKYFDCASGNIFGTSNCPVADAPVGNCQQNHTVLASDSFYNDSFSAVGNEDNDNDSQFDGGAFAGSASSTLADVAMHYYERDLHALSDQVPLIKRDIERDPSTPKLTVDDTLHQHMTTTALSFGVNGDITSMPENAAAPASPAWPDPAASDKAKIDDLRHAAYNGRGRFLSVTEPTAISEVFGEIGVAEGAASSVAFNTQNVESDSLIFRAFFNTSTNAGSLIAQRVYADGTIDSNRVWNAAVKLDSKTPNDRVIITKTDQSSSDPGRAFRWNNTDLTTAQQNKLHDPKPCKPKLLFGCETLYVGQQRLNYLRGDTTNYGNDFNSGKLRPRPIPEGKLGDIVHSSPVFVGEPPHVGRLGGAWPGHYDTNPGALYATFKGDNADRRGLVYVGANDGMLHAFDGNTGEEVFAYVPNVLFNDLSKLTHPAYDHRFYIDLTPSVNDVFMKKPNASTETWNTVLIGGLGAGGKGYFALNVTDPTKLVSEAEAKMNVMWEFTEVDDGTVGNSDLGYTFSQPLIAMSNAHVGGDPAQPRRWVAIFGNGFNSTSAAGNAGLYVLFIEQGQDGSWAQSGDFIKINTGFGKAQDNGTTPNGVAGIRGIDIDSNGTVDRVYAGDLQGNLFRFDLSSTNPSTWASTVPAVLFQASYTSGSTTKKQPFTTRPVVIKHPSKDGYIVLAATGSYMTYEDATNRDIQSIYGIWDDGGSTIVNRSQLVEQSFTNYVDPEHGYTVRTLTANPVEWRNSGQSDAWKKGWFIDLDVPEAGGSTIEFPGERAVRNLQLRGQFAFVNTVIPKSTETCAGGAGGYELAFDPATGGAPMDVVFDIDGNRRFDLNDNIGNQDGRTHVVAGIRFAHVPTDAAFISHYRVTQQSDTSVRSVGTNTIVSVQSGRSGWREVGF